MYPDPEVQDHRYYLVLAIVVIIVILYWIVTTIYKNKHKT